MWHLMLNSLEEAFPSSLTSLIWFFLTSSRSYWKAVAMSAASDNVCVAPIMLGWLFEMHLGEMSGKTLGQRPQAQIL
jgi:hypothetical protein